MHGHTRSHYYYFCVRKKTFLRQIISNYASKRTKLSNFLKKKLKRISLNRYGCALEFSELKKISYSPLYSLSCIKLYSCIYGGYDHTHHTCSVIDILGALIYLGGGAQNLSFPPLSSVILATPLSRSNSIQVVVWQSIKYISGVSRILFRGWGGGVGFLIPEKLFKMLRFKVFFVSTTPKKF